MARFVPPEGRAKTMTLFNNVDDCCSYDDDDDNNNNTNVPLRCCPATTIDPSPVAGIFKARELDGTISGGGREGQLFNRPGGAIS
jgi:hypothetical protein